MALVFFCSIGDSNILFPKLSWLTEMEFQSNIKQANNEKIENIN